MTNLLDDRLAAVVQRALLPSMVGVGLLLGLPVLAGLANPSSVIVASITIAVAGLLVTIESGERRRTFLALFGLAYVLRLVVLIVVYWLGVGAGGPFLGPDSTGYLAGSQTLAARGFDIPMHPALFFGSYDSIHYYLFALGIWALDADLFTLQLMNSGCTALVGPLMFSTCRVLVPRHAVLIGAVVSLFPSLVVFSALDLLKDPSVLLALMLAVWGLTRLSEIRPPGVMAWTGICAACGVIYLRMDRFYLVAFLEVSLIGMALVALARQRWHRAAVRAGAPLIVVFLVAELVPAGLGWPPTPLMVQGQLSHLARALPAMVGYEPGLVDRLRPGGGESDGEQFSGDPRLGRFTEPSDDRADPSPAGLTPEAASSPAANPGGPPPGRDPPPEPAQVEAATGAPGPPAAPAEAVTEPAPPPPPEDSADPVDSTSRARSSEAVPPVVDVPSSSEPAPASTPPASPAAETAASGVADPDSRSETRVLTRVAAFFANMFRKLYGPFIWIWPERWTVREILTNDYLLYPGMLLWYAMLPFTLAGLAITGRRVLSRGRTPFMLGVLCSFFLMNLVFYLAFNVSYRQRALLFPFALLFAILGVGVFQHRGFRWGYGAYWVGLVGVAAGHLALRFYTGQ